MKITQALLALQLFKVFFKSNAEKLLPSAMTPDKKKAVINAITALIVLAMVYGFIPAEWTNAFVEYFGSVYSLPSLEAK